MEEYEEGSEEEQEELRGGREESGESEPSDDLFARIARETSTFPLH
jgi:hypothetical protein